MKKKLWFFGIVILVFAVVAAVAIAAHNGNGNVTPDQPGEVQHEEGSAKQEKKANTETEPEKEPVKTEEELGKVAHTAAGILTGRIDSHSVEIEVDGQLKAFALSGALQEKEFAPGEIRFQYYVDKNGRSVITEADFKKPREAEVLTAEGTFQGLADNHTAEIKINGQYWSFALAEHISFEAFTEGEKIFIAYQENEQGRQEIIKIEKMW